MSGQSKDVFTDSGRDILQDQKIDNDVIDEKLINKLFVRLVSKGKTFRNVDFKYGIFDQAYLRNCVFDSCDFTGCRFTNTNLTGSVFDGCKFEYATFEKTTIDSDVLLSNCPGPENLKQKFARTLRTNYQSLGDAQSANLAVGIELKATEEHLRKAWKSKEGYYRKKYKGWKKVKAFGQWLEFKTLDFIWGNGESAWKLARTALYMNIVIAFNDAFRHKDYLLVKTYLESLWLAPQIFLGVMSPDNYSGGWLATIFFVRLVIFGFFMSIIIKRFNRR